MDLKIDKPVRNAFNTAARVGTLWAAALAVTAMFTGTFELGAVMVGAVTAFGVAHRYEKKLEAQQQKDAESSRPSEGPGW